MYSNRYGVTVPSDSKRKHNNLSRIGIHPKSLTQEDVALIGQYTAQEDPNRKATSQAVPPNIMGDYGDSPRIHIRRHLNRHQSDAPSNHSRSNQQCHCGAPLKIASLSITIDDTNYRTTHIPITDYRTIWTEHVYAKISRRL